MHSTGKNSVESICCIYFNISFKIMFYYGPTKANGNIREYRIVRIDIQ